MKADLRHSLRVIQSRVVAMAKHFVDDSLWLRLVSILAAVMIWAFVISQDAAIRFYNVNNLRVEVVGEQELAAKGLAVKQDISELITRNVSVRLEGVKSLISAISDENIHAVVDLGAITNEGENQVLPITFTGTDGVSVSRISPYSSVTLDVETLYTRQVPVVVVFTGGLPDGYMMPGSDSFTVSPAQITITGTQSDVQAIKAAYVPVDLTSTTSSVNKQYEFTLTDGMFNQIDAPTVETSATAVIVRADVYATKSVPVQWRASLQGTPAFGYEVASVAVNPSSITIAGDAGLLASIDRVFTGTVGLDGQKESFTQNIGVIAQTGIKWMEFDNVDIRVEIKEVSETTVISNLPISYVNAPENAAVSLDTEFATVAVTGPASYVRGISRAGIKAYVNLIATSYGTTPMYVTFEAASPDAPMLTFTQVLVNVTVTQAEAASAEAGN